MQSARRLKAFATRRRGTVAQANLRRAAGVGVVAACLLVSGPSVAVAIADPGGSHSGHSGNGKGSDSSGRSGSRGGSDSSGNISNNIRSAQKSTTRTTSDAPRTTVGSSPDAGTSNERPGSDYSPHPSGSFKPPTVTFGDGRTPGVQDNDGLPRIRHAAPEPATSPPLPPPVITTPAPSWADRIYLPPGAPQQLGVTQAADLTDPLWGFAGLLLIPMAGAVLGYRQARAAQAAAELGRHP
jgi:hypothetical protein